MRNGTMNRVLVVVAALGLAACDSSGPTESESDSLVATWDVRSIDGQTLPITESEDMGNGLVCTFTFSSASITFQNSGRFTSSIVASGGCTGMPTQSFNETTAGTWRVQGSTLFMKEDPDEDGENEEEASTFTRSGDMLTITSTDDGTVVVLERR